MTNQNKKHLGCTYKYYLVYYCFKLAYKVSTIIHVYYIMHILYLAYNKWP